MECTVLPGTNRRRLCFEGSHFGEWPGTGEPHHIGGDQRYRVGDVLRGSVRRCGFRLMRRRERSVRSRGRSPARRQPLELGNVSAHAKPAIPPKVPVAVEGRQAREFGLEPPASLRRPRHEDVAPGLARNDGAGDASFRIDAEFLVELGPRPARHVLCRAAEQVGEFVRVEEEPARRVHLPDEPQRMAPLFRTRLRLGKVRFELGRFALRRFDLGRFDLSRFDLGRFDLGRFDLARFDLGRFNSGRFDLGRSDLGRFERGGFGRPRFGDRIGEAGEQHGARPAADPLENHRADARSPLRTPGRERCRRERCGVDRAEPRPG
jgi:hypothetical protein